MLRQQVSAICRPRAQYLRFNHSSFSSSAHPVLSPSDHPLLQRIQYKTKCLDPVTSVLTFTAAHVASGNLSALANDWTHLMHNKEHRALGYEIVIQMHLLAGFPRTISALSTIREAESELRKQWAAAGIPAFDLEAEASMDRTAEGVEKWKHDGDKFMASIYGKPYAKLRRSMKELHPGLDRWVEEHAYGRVLSRDGAPPKLRELCTVAVLAGQLPSVSPQLIAHIRGSMLVGASREEVRAVLDQTELLWSKEDQEHADAVWETFQNSRALS